MDIKNIIAQMTVEEKASLCSGDAFWETKAVERLGVPSVTMNDGPHGLRKQDENADHLGMSHSIPATCFPTASLTACSFDRALLSEMGAALADECIAENVQIVLGPGANIKRSPLCGRNFEYFSEDPLLSGEMAAAHIGGVQSKGVGASLKHFAANNQENRRNSSDSVIDRRTLHEIYLKSFEIPVKKSKPATVMCSYNKLNGEYASENRTLLTGVLRDKWGFEGIVMSDWGAVDRRVKGLEAGLELEMPGSRGIRDAQIVEAVKSGELPMATLDLAVERLLKTVEKLSAAKECKPYDKDGHHQLARRIARESMVLLKNDGLLPLKRDAKIVFIGEFAENPRYQGAGSSQINPTKLTCALEASRRYAEVSYSKGFEIRKCDVPDRTLFEQAVAAASDAEICVVFAGLPPSYESEGFDRDHMKLPAAQNMLIERLAETCSNIVVVLQNGAPVEMPWLGGVNAVLEAYLGGQAGGDAIADVLFGEANPCGKLAESFPRKLSDNPSYLFYQGERDTVEYREGVFVGYRYYDIKEAEVLFPFGHGLSYTTYEYSNLKLSANSIKDTDRLTVTLDVKNTGAMAGKEIVQLYVGKKEKDDIVIRPLRELRGFEKVALEPGETKSVSITLDKSAFAYYNTEIDGFHVLSGDYLIHAGSSSRQLPLQAEVHVESTVHIPFRATINTPLKDILRMKGGREFLDEMMAPAKGFVSGIENSEPGTLEYMFERMMPEMVLRMLVMMAPDAPSPEQVQEMLDQKLNS